MTNDMPQLDVFYGDLSPARAHLYARLPRPPDDAGLTLTGLVRGPRCLHAQTLPAMFPMVDLGPGPTLLARTVVPEPTFWSPELPAIYDVTVNLQRGDELLASARFEIGLRSFGVRGRDFVLAGKRWVLRGVMPSSTTATLPRAWHDASAVFVASWSDLADDQLAEASQFGALAVVELAAGGAHEIRRLARHPAVALAVQQHDFPSGMKRADVPPNILLGQRMGDGDRVIRQPWADVLLVESTVAELLARITALGDLPVVVVRPLAQSLPIDDARAACDQLQRDLAPLGQFAGYIV
jgi:hypothetical protein